MIIKINKRKIKTIGISAAVLILAAVICVKSGVFSTKYNYTGEPYVCLDAGHGADDVGATNGTRYEKDDDLALTLKVRDKLEALGVKTLLTREDDSDITLKERCKTANKNKCTLFVCLHRNSADDTTANGIEAWVSNNPKGDETKLAKNLIKNICEVTGQKNRGVKSGYRDDPQGEYYINSDTDMPSLLLEVGFVTNENDNKAFDEQLDTIAETIAETIYDSIKK